MTFSGFFQSSVLSAGKNIDMSFDVSFMSSLTNLPRAFKPQTCRPVTRCTGVSVNEQHVSPRTLSGYWVMSGFLALWPCSAALGPSVKAIATAVKDIGRAAAKI